MSRPGAWTRVAQNFWKYLKNDFSKKNYVGQDVQGHRFYEITNSRQNVSRGFDPPTENPTSQPSQEWQAWLRGTRRFPPSDQEIALNMARQQAQLAENVTTEKKAPSVHSEGKNAEKTSNFPHYKDFEVTPGYKNEEK